MPAISSFPHLTPAQEMPWTVSSPFKMRPGLSRADCEIPLFVRDAQAIAYMGAKGIALEEHGVVGQCAEQAVFDIIVERYAAQTGIELCANVRDLTLGMQEDFVILHDDTDGQMRTELLSVCFPSNWNPSDKWGLDFAAIHAPVADNAMLMAGQQGIVDIAFRKQSMLRHVWLLSPDGELSQHPSKRGARWLEALGDEAGSLLSKVYFRVERQTTLPLPELKRGVFFIRPMVAPLVEVLAQEQGRANTLAEAIASMSEAVIDYRGMSAAKERLLAELQGFEPT